MKKIVFKSPFIVVFLLFCSLLGGIQHADVSHPFAWGEGTAENPYQIATVDQLQMSNIKNRLSIMIL